MTLTEEEYKSRVNAFLDKYSSAYTDIERMIIRGSAGSGATDEYITDGIRQIYDELGILQERHDIYAGFLKILEQNFDINQDIIEVGAGIIPCLARRIANKKVAGKITIYDPRLLIPKREDNKRMVIKRQSFKEDTDLQGATLLVGFMPCEATPIILDCAEKNNIDFIIALCEGGARTGFEWLEEDDEWISTMYHIAEVGLRNNGNIRTLKTASLKQYGDEYPVIYTKKIKS